MLCHIVKKVDAGSMKNYQVKWGTCKKSALQGRVLIK